MYAVTCDLLVNGAIVLCGAVYTTLDVDTVRYSVVPTAAAADVAVEFMQRISVSV